MVAENCIGRTLVEPHTRRLAMSRFVMPDYDPALTKTLHEVIVSEKVRKLQTMLQKRNGSLVYVDDQAYALAKIHMPKQLPRLNDHMRRHFHGIHD